LSLQQAFLAAASREGFLCNLTLFAARHLGIVIATQGQVVFETDFWSQHPEKEFLCNKVLSLQKKNKKILAELCCRNSKSS